MDRSAGVGDGRATFELYVDPERTRGLRFIYDTAGAAGDDWEINASLGAGDQASFTSGSNNTWTFAPQVGSELARLVASFDSLINNPWGFDSYFGGARATDTWPPGLTSVHLTGFSSGVGLSSGGVRVASDHTWNNRNDFYTQVNGVLGTSFS